MSQHLPKNNTHTHTRARARAQTHIHTKDCGVQEVQVYQGLTNLIKKKYLACY